MERCVEEIFAECMKRAYFKTETSRPGLQNAHSTSVNESLHVYLSC